MLGLGSLLVIAGLAYTMVSTRKAPNGSLVVVLLASLAIGSTSNSPFEFESAYFCGSVVADEEDASVRYLVLDRLRHAAVDLDDPTTSSSAKSASSPV